MPSFIFCIELSLHLPSESLLSLKVMGLQMTINISSRHSNLNFAHHFVFKLIYWLLQNGANKNQHQESHQRETIHSPKTRANKKKQWTHVGAQGRSQPLTPAWARKDDFLNLSSFSCSFSHFSSIFLHFLPHFGLPGGALATPLWVPLNLSRFRSLIVHRTLSGDEND